MNSCLSKAKNKNGHICQGNPKLPVISLNSEVLSALSTGWCIARLLKCNYFTDTHNVLLAETHTGTPVDWSQIKGSGMKFEKGNKTIL